MARKGVINPSSPQVPSMIGYSIEVVEASLRQVILLQTIANTGTQLCRDGPPKYILQNSRIGFSGIAGV